MTELEKIGIRIKERRTAMGLTLEELAAKIGVAASTVQRYENGRITRPKLPVVKAIADALGCTADSLAGLDETDTAEITYIMPDDSMAPFILKGDKVTLRRSDVIENGLLLCSADGGKNALYRVDTGAHIVLRCDDPGCPPKVFCPEESGRITVIGRAVRITRDLE